MRDEECSPLSSYPCQSEWLSRTSTGQSPRVRVGARRVALFSGNYNCVRDGANNALNRLCEHLQWCGASVRVYSPTNRTPAFAPAGELISVRSVHIPGRSEYRFGLPLSRTLRADIVTFAPNIIHVSAPDALGWSAQTLGRQQGVPVVASLHTRFETYLTYYGLNFARRWVEYYLRSFYSRCDLVLAPTPPLADELRRFLPEEQVAVWSRGVDESTFSPSRRDMCWRRGLGYSDDEPIILFFGRLVREKGIATFAKIVSLIRSAGLPVRPLVIGAGPSRAEMARLVGDAVFTGHLEGHELGRAVACADILLNPSTTEAFGNVNLEGMASGLVVVSADVASARALIEDSKTGFLVDPHSTQCFASLLIRLMQNPSCRQHIALAAVRAAAQRGWPTVLDQVLKAYDRTVSYHPHPVQC
ncbi:glycosyl transferase family 1 [Sphingopyxis sp. GW247-27LB]|nr:glycosyl transferase family 1 [Sphingopyxis sp. GW247-27LB]